MKNKLFELIEKLDKKSLSFHNVCVISELSEAINNIEFLDTSSSPPELPEQSKLAEGNAPSKCIGILDDDKHIQNLLTVYFNKYGYEVKNYLNPLVALDEIEQNNLSLLFVDLMMPDMNGIEFINKFKANKKTNKIKIFVGSSKNNNIDKVNAMRAGASDFIQKPYNLSELLHKVEQHFKKN